MGQNFIGCSCARHHRDFCTGGGQTAKNIVFDTVIYGDNMKLGFGLLTKALPQFPAGFIPSLGLAAGDIDCQVHAL